MKKLLHPLIPLFILLILGGKYLYDFYWTHKYNEKEILLLERTRNDGDNLSKLLLNTADRSVGTAKNYIAEMGNPPSLQGIFEKTKVLEDIYEKYLEKINSSVSLYEKEKELTYSTDEEKKVFYNSHFSTKNLKIQTLFQEYIQEIKKVDTLLFQKYQDYTFQDGETNEELNKKYLQGKSIEIFIYLARIKAELAHIYSESTVLLAEEYGYFIFTSRTTHSVFVPMIHKSQKDNPYVSVVEVVPFIDSIRRNVERKDYFQTNVKYYIDDEGFFVIDEEGFDVENLELKWFPNIDYNENYGRTYLAYRKKGIQYEK